jgi:cytochrome c-type biogenesis protein CcmH
VKALALALLLSFAASTAHAIGPDEMLKDPALEARAHEIGTSLRCLVCQNESIEESNADLAKDLRKIIRERVKAGESDRQVIDFMVSRYGQFVLLRPPVEPETWALWFGPALLLAGAGAFVLIRARRRRRTEAAPLSAEESAELQRLLDARPLDAPPGARP